MGFIWPLQRELNLWVVTKLLEKTRDSNTTSSLIPILTSNITVNIIYAFFMALIIGSSTTQMTTYSILLVDFILNPI